MHFPIDSSTHCLAFTTVGLHCQTPTLTHACLCREAVCTIFMMVFGMTRPGGELTTYCARGGRATDWANPTRFVDCKIDSLKKMEIWRWYIHTYYICINYVQCVFLFTINYLHIEIHVQEPLAQNMLTLNKFKLKLKLTSAKFWCSVSLVKFSIRLRVIMIKQVNCYVLK